MSASALLQVVELNEDAKTIRRYAFEVSLSALGAIVRSSRAGTELRGFNEVAAQMRHWSRDLEEAVNGVTLLCNRRVRLVSGLVLGQRMHDFLQRAADGSNGHAAAVDSAAAQSELLASLQRELVRTDAVLSDALDSIMQLGMMASVLSRAALIEAASGEAQERQELTLASRDFAAYAERVNDAISALRKHAHGRYR